MLTQPLLSLENTLVGPTYSKHFEVGDWGLECLHQEMLGMPVRGEEGRRMINRDPLGTNARAGHPQQLRLPKGHSDLSKGCGQCYSGSPHSLQEASGSCMGWMLLGHWEIPTPASGLHLSVIASSTFLKSHCPD